MKLKAILCKVQLNWHTSSYADKGQENILCITNIRHEREDITTDPTEIKRV